jgi:hypothetical protein
VLLVAMLKYDIPHLGNAFVVNIAIAAMLFPFALSYIHKLHPELAPKTKTPKQTEPVEHPLGSTFNSKSPSDLISSIAKNQQRYSVS